MEDKVKTSISEYLNGTEELLDLIENQLFYSQPGTEDVVSESLIDRQARRVQTVNERLSRINIALRAL